MSPSETREGMKVEGFARGRRKEGEREIREAGFQRSAKWRGGKLLKKNSRSSRPERETYYFDSLISVEQ